MMNEWMKKNSLVFVIVFLLMVILVAMTGFNNGEDLDYEPTDRCQEIAEHEDLEEGLECECRSPEMYDVGEVEETVEKATYVSDVLVCSSDMEEEDFIFPIRVINETKAEEIGLNETDLPNETDMIPDNY